MCDYFQMREHFYDELKVALFENYQHLYLQTNKQLQEKDMHDMVSNLEYKIFSSTKVPNKYKFDMSKLVRITFYKHTHTYICNFVHKIDYFYFIYLYTDFVSTKMYQ